MKRSVVSFIGKSRLHVGIGVTDIDESVAFYTSLFGVTPSKTRSGYARFETEEPRVNLSLNQSGQPTTIALPGHFGIQVKSTDAVAIAAERLRSAGLETRIETDENCCHAVQDKVWATDPDGNRWEVYVVLDDEPATDTMEEKECCATDCCSE